MQDVEVELSGRFPILDALAADDRAQLLQSCRRRRFRAGEVLFHEHDPGDTFHFLLAGNVSIQSLTRDGDVVTLAVLHAPDTFGEQALLDPAGRRTAGVVAIEPTVTLALHRDDFQALRRSHPAVNGLLVDVLAAQVRRLSRQLVECLHTPAEERVLRRLHDVASGFATSNGTIQVPLSQEALASLAGTTRPTANRALQAARDAGAIEIARRRIDVQDLGLLAEIAQVETL